MTNALIRLSAALSGHYRIEKKLGEGGMASVFLAEDLKHERKVAIKVLRPELAAIVGGERFLAEIKTTANLQHPNILPLFDSGEADGFLFYVMPYIEGESLRERLDRDQQLPVEEAVNIAVKVAGALDAAHQQGVVHRDVKPANILMARGEPLVADFGIALAVQNAGAGRLTETGLSLGTPFYMSPEQATAERDPGPASDIYSLGCVLYEMLVGEPPFTGPSAQAIVAKLITAEAPEITGQRKTVPEHVAEAVRVALHKLPADRFAGAADFAAALKDAGRVPVGARHTGASGASGARRGRSRIVATWLPWTAAVLGVGAALFFALGAPAPAPLHAARFTLGLPNTDGVRATTGFLGVVALSPGGTQMVFSGTQSGRTRLYRRALGGLAVEPLPGTDDAVYPVFSPDGSDLAFATGEGVYHLLLDGGQPRRVATPPDPPIGIAWTPDRHLLFGMLWFNGEYRGLTEVPVDGDGQLRKLTQPKSMQHWPYVLPDGRYALYTDYDVPGGGLALFDLRSEQGEVLHVDGAPIPLRWVIGVSGDVLLFLDRQERIMAARWDPGRHRALGAPAPVPGQPAGIAAAALSPDGTLAMVTGPTAFQIAMVGADGDLQRLVAPDSVAQAVPRFSPRGSRLLLTAPLGGGDPETWIVDPAGGVTSQLSMGVPPGYWPAEWTADGSAVLVGPLTRSDSLRGLWLRPADASAGARHVVGRLHTGARDPSGARALPLPDSARDSDTDEAFIGGISVHPDGNTLALTVSVGGNRVQPRWDIYLGGVDGDAMLTPFATGEADEVAARFSPDGRWIAYASNESGRFQVYVRPFPGPGARVQVSAEGGGQPIWSRDGRRIFYRTEDALMAADVSVDAGTLHVSGRKRLFQATLAGGVGDPQAGYDVSPDGKSFAVVRAVGKGAGDIVVWKDWLDELRPLLGEKR